MSKASQRLTVIIFCGFLAAFGILHLILPDRDFSPVENRTLAQVPTFTWNALLDGTYTAEMEEYLQDQFPLRDGWMGLKNRCELLLGKREFHGVYLCGDRLIHKIEDAGREAQNIGFVRDLTELTDIPVYVGMIPTAAEVYEDMLPKGSENFNQTDFLERMRTGVPGAIWVDIAGVLEAHREEPVFYRTDHHWTSLGAYYGYSALMDAMGAVSAPLGEGVTVSENFYGTLYSTSGVHWLKPDTIERYVFDENTTVEDVQGGETHGLYVDRFLGEKDQYASFLGGNAPLYIVRNPDAVTNQTLLVVRDSYSDCLAPFLSRYFAEIHLLDLRYYRTSVAQYAEENHMDQIFVCYSVENFVKDIDAVFIGR